MLKMTHWSGPADTGGKVNSGAAFIQNDGLVLSKFGFSRDVYVMGIHHSPDPLVPGADVVVLVCAVVKLPSSAFRRRRNRSCHINAFKLSKNSNDM
jgi:hypothetical protein